jgi:hypothetical protein
MLAYLSIVERTGSHSIRFVGPDVLAAAKFLEFIGEYSPNLIP